MTQKRQQTVTWLIGLAPFLIAEPVWTVEPSTEATELKKAPLLSELDTPARTIDEWLAQAIVQINEVRLDPTDAEFKIVLEVAAGQQLTFTRAVVDNAIVINIPNAVLSLPKGNEFQAEAPTEDIASVNVANQPNNQVRLTITGTDAPPEVDSIATAQGLAFSVFPGIETAQSPEAEPEAELEEEEIVVTGEEETGYRVPAASVGTRTDTPLRNVPQAIQVSPKQVLEDQQILRLEDALRNATGATQGTQSSPIGLQHHHHSRL